ncbi:hypothetical protein [Peribacillus sp. NPDC097895]|uniref:hypothetical protein n=1 Tax=Peribacillus sp. NPDC097895 TaxID=3390619 RepID=UPI003D038215
MSKAVGGICLYTSKCLNKRCKRNTICFIFNSICSRLCALNNATSPSSIMIVRIDFFVFGVSNEELVIPILGELKTFIEDNQQLIQNNDKTQEIGRKLEKFISGIENKSDLPSVKMIWPQKGIRLGVEHTYKDRKYSFFMYYDELVDSKERMDYVREYLIGSYRALNEAT